MDYNDLISKIKKTSGLSGGRLSTSMSNNDIKDIIKKLVLPTFGRYFKTTEVFYDVTFDITDRINDTTFKLPGYITDMIYSNDIEILGVRNIEHASKRNVRRHSAGMYGNIFGEITQHQQGNNSIFAGHNPAVSVAMADSLTDELSFGEIKAMVKADKYIEFSRPIYNPADVHLNLTLVLSHPGNLSTIDAGMYELFTTLATLQVRQVMWEEEFKYIAQMDLGFTTIDLNLDLFSNANEELKAFKEQMDDNSVFSDIGSITTT